VEAVADAGAGWSAAWAAGVARTMTEAAPTRVAASVRAGGIVWNLCMERPSHPHVGAPDRRPTLIFSTLWNVSRFRRSFSVVKFLDAAVSTAETMTDKVPVTGDCSRRNTGAGGQDGG
jgi:hypothetical protein